MFTPRRTRSRFGVIAALVLAVCLATAGVAPTIAHADESLYQRFYTPPNPLPAGKPGDVVRSEPSRLALEPSGQLGAFMATGTRIMYRSTDGRGNPTTVTGTYFEPYNAWPGTGPRPLLSFATLPYGLGEQCAPSRMFNQGIHFSGGWDIMFNFEETFLATMVARGFAVVVTDYDGLGRPGGVAAFANRLAAGYAVLDAARAAKKLPDTSLTPDSPVAFWGYATGGQASASAAELAADYAPELKVVGAWAGAVPADLAELVPYVDGSILAGALGYLLNGIGAVYPEAAEGLMGTLTPRGVELLTKTRDLCLLQTMGAFGFRHVQPYFNTDINELLGAQPLKGLLDAQRLGTMKPSIPVYLDANRYDPFVPYNGVHQLAQDWCARGADVQLWTNEQPPFLNKTATNHLLTYWVDGERSMQWITDRFNGLPTTPNCGDL